MKATLHTYTVKELCEGFTYSELDGKGLYGLAGKLTINLNTSATISIVRIKAKKKLPSLILC